MVVSDLNRRLAWLKVTVCLGLPWLRPNHNVAPGNRMSPWRRANLRICASPASNQELKNVVCGLAFPLSPLLVQSHFLAFPSASLISFSSIHYPRCAFMSSRCADLYCPCPLPSALPFFLLSILLSISLNAVTLLCITHLQRPELTETQAAAISFSIIWSQGQDYMQPTHRKLKQVVPTQWVLANFTAWYASRQ